MTFSIGSGCRPDQGPSIAEEILVGPCRLSDPSRDRTHHEEEHDVDSDYLDVANSTDDEPPELLDDTTVASERTESVPDA